jgi:hypothetical protein
MCQYCNRVTFAIQRTYPVGFWMGRCVLKIAGLGIQYTKFSKKTGKPYSKTIPLTSLCQAKSIMGNQGLNGVNRTWHNSLTEGKNRPCNLKVIEQILTTFR